jgi:hypothetical protein
MSDPNSDQTPQQPVDDHAEQQRAAAARRSVQQRRAFHVHAGVFAGGMLVILLVNLATNVAAGIAGEWWAWWSAWVFIGWGLGVAVHGLVVRLHRPVRPTSTWERARSTQGWRDTAAGHVRWP